MCGPAAPLVAGLVLTAASTAFTVHQQRQQAEFEEDVLKSEAKAERTAAALRAEDRRRRLNRSIAEQKVLFGASGTQIDAEILAETGAEFAREQFNDDFNLNRSQLNYEASASNLQATQNNAAISGVMSFAGQAGSALVNSGAFRDSPSNTGTDDSVSNVGL